MLASGLCKVFFNGSVQDFECPDEKTLALNGKSADDMLKSMKRYKLLEDGMLIFTATIFRKSDFMASGGFSADMKCDDTVLFYNLFRYASGRNRRFAVIPEQVLFYRRHENNVSSQKLAASTLRGLLESDYKMRNYYQRGVKCHYPILREVQEFSETNPDFVPLYQYFEHHFNELKRQAFFWKKSWKERIDDAHISGPFWRKIPWAIRVLCPFTYALAAKIMKKS
jgi:hypothetical protein